MDLVPTDLMAIEIFIPDDISVRHIPVSKLPRDWRKYPPPTALQKFGNSWLDSDSSCILRVPSAVIPTESNLLINPKHEEIRRIKVVRKFDFRFDPRVVSR
jgi:RES domain-containing protein